MGKKEISELIEKFSLDFVMADSSSPESYTAAAEKAKALNEIFITGGGEAAEICAAINGLMDKFVRGTADSSDSKKVTEKISMLLSKSDPHQLTEKIAAPAREEKEETPAAGAVPEISTDLSLVSDFIHEATEHLDNVNSKLLVVESSPADEEAINSLFRAFHTIKSLSGFLELTELHAVVKEVENLLSGARKGAIAMNTAVIDVLFSAADAARKMTEELKKNPSKKTGLITQSGLEAVLEQVQYITGTSVAAKRQKLGEILVQEGKADETDIKEALLEQKVTHEKIGSVLQHHNAVSSADIAGALMEQKVTEETAVRVKETVKIDLEKLDRLIDTIGEMVIAESMVVNDKSISEGASAVFMGNVNHLNKTTKMLHELGLSLRLIPAAGMFQKMARVARDLSRKHNKKINFVYRGEDTEIDRTVVEKISDPLIHMIRNSIDHGIESAAERKAAGKTETALIELNAYHKGGSVYIEIQDDGSGLNMEKILRRAAENGIISESSQLSKEEIFDLIFRPGFSTASVVTDTSGRGVGMDVVRKNVEQLRGRVVVGSEAGKGTKFTVVLPLTTAIIEAIAVKVKGEKYFIPSLSIIESARPESSLFSTVNNKGVMLSFRNSFVPVFSLGGLFGDGCSAGETAQGDKIIVIVEENGKRAGIAVDEILEPQQIVVKSLGKSFDKTEGIAACTIMSDGKVGLIIDVSGIIKMATAV